MRVFAPGAAAGFFWVFWGFWVFLAAMGIPPGEVP